MSLAQTWRSIGNFSRLYTRSKTARVGWGISCVSYLSYAAAAGQWDNPGLIAASTLFGVALPFYAKASNRIEQLVMEASGMVTPGRTARFLAQFIFNLALLAGLSAAGVFGAAGGNLETLGGVAGSAVIITAASQGSQFIGLVLARRGLGDPMRNVLMGLAANIVASAIATAGAPAIAQGYAIASTIIGISALGWGFLSDLRSLFPTTGGVGVYFGTFNPAHRGHLRCIAEAFRRRGLDRVYIHPTIVPAGHANAIAKGELAVETQADGFTRLRRTDRADILLDYFPTGDRFLPPEIRRDLLKLALADKEACPVSDHQVEVIWMPELYTAGGFPAVFRHIANLHRDAPIHVIHGADAGGMMVRTMMDECGWVYPLVCRRTDGVSATKIRDGALHLTTAGVAARLLEMNAATAAQGA